VSQSVVTPAEGLELTLHNLRVRYKVRGEDTGGVLAVLEMELQPGILVKPHRHTREDEVSIVLEGTVWSRVGDDEHETAAGAYLVKPRGIPHALWNTAERPARVAEIITPAGFERYFEEIEPVLRQSGPDWTQLFKEIASRYGIEVLDDWSDELQAKYGVKL
jgi:quercetin dioxygenase-like cupin family protein